MHRDWCGAAGVAHAVSKNFGLSTSCGLNAPDIGTPRAFASMRDHQRSRDLSECDDCDKNGIHINWRGLVRAFRQQCAADGRPVPSHLD